VRERRLGKYTLERPIASGGMGEVHLASASGPDGVARAVAIKFLRPELVASHQGRELFLQEGLALAALDHPNIVQVIELASEEDDLYLVMEYLDGVDLGRVMKREGALPWRLAVYVVAEAARGVAAAHARRIVHGDVTPSNVFLCAGGTVKVLDFGLARPAGPQSATFSRQRGVSASRGAPSRAVPEGGGVRGKLPYLPPEVLLGGAADQLADVYGLGAVLHECLTGQPLFRAGNDPETVWRALRDPVPRPSELADVPPELDKVVAAAMARDQSARTRSAGGLADQLEASLAGGFTAHDLARWLPDRIAAANQPLPPTGPAQPPARKRLGPVAWIARLRAALK